MVGRGLANALAPERRLRRQGCARQGRGIGAATGAVGGVAGSHEAEVRSRQRAWGNALAGSRGARTRVALARKEGVRAVLAARERSERLSSSRHTARRPVAGATAASGPPGTESRRGTAGAPTR
jgi:hypothetical protein